MSKLFFIGEVEDYKPYITTEDTLVMYGTDFNFGELYEYCLTRPFISDYREVLLVHAEAMTAAELDKVLSISVPEFTNLLVFHKTALDANKTKKITGKGFELRTVGVATKAASDSKVAFELVDTIFTGNVCTALMLYQKALQAGEISPQQILALVSRHFIILFGCLGPNPAKALVNFKLPGFALNKYKKQAAALTLDRVKYLHNRFVLYNSLVGQNPQHADIYTERFIVCCGE